MKTSEPPDEAQTITMRDFLIFGLMLGCVIFVAKFIAWSLFETSVNPILFSVWLLIYPEQRIWWHLDGQNPIFGSYFGSYYAFYSLLFVGS